MSELDDSGAEPLIDVDVPVDAERHVATRKRRRQTLAAAVVVVVLAAVALVGALAASSKRQGGRAATAPPATTTVTALAATTTAAQATTTAPAPTTTVATIPETSSPVVATVDVCPAECIGRATADVDGDGRPDQIGLSANPPLSEDATGNTPSELVVKVAFANGQVAEYDDSADWDASLVGAVDLDGDGAAEIFYFYFTGANNRMGRILRWNGTQLVAVQGSDGKPFTTFTSGYAMGSDGFQCSNDTYVAKTIHDDGPSPDSPTGWNASEITYRLSGDQLVEVSGPQPIPIAARPAGFTGDFYIPPEYNDVMGVHCPGVTPGYPYTSTSP